MREILFEKEARDKLRKGVELVANAVRITMGHKGRAVLIPKASPIFTLDGVTVAQAVTEVEDEFENMGIQLVKKVAQGTDDQAGDGTTTATVLTSALLAGGLDGVELKVDPITMKRAFEDGTKLVLAEVKRKAKPVKTKEQMQSIATISSRDEEIGGLVAGLYDQLGKDALITTEEVKTIGVDTEIMEGMQLDNGWAIPHFITNFERKIAQIEDAHILVTTQNISTNNDLPLQVMEEVMRTDSKSLLIVAEDVQGEALATLALNNRNRVMNILVVKAPGLGDNKRAHLEDICAMTGATLITEEIGMRVENASMENLGRAKRVIAHQNRSIIIGGKGKKAEIETRIKQIENDKKNTESKMRQQLLEKRIAKLKGRVAIIRVGDVTDDAAKEKMYRIEDAVKSTRSAIEEGVVEGGGMALYRASNVLDVEIEKAKDNNYRYGLTVLRNAIRRPAEQILENAGEDAKVVLSHDYKVDAHVIDPAKVERVALELAVSTVGLFLITGAVIADVREKAKK